MRRSYGRDFGLSLRMAVALAAIGLLYLGFEALAGWMAFDGIRAGDLGLVFSGLVFGGAIVAALVAQLRKSEQLILRTAHAEIIGEENEPEFQELVARVAAQADLPRPRVAVLPSWAPNALTAARRPSTAVLVVTTELLRRLEPHELEAVVAHELAHVANRDGPVLTFVGGPAMAMGALCRLFASSGGGASGAASSL